MCGTFEIEGSGGVYLLSPSCFHVSELEGLPCESLTLGFMDEDP